MPGGTAQLHTSLLFNSYPMQVRAPFLPPIACRSHIAGPAAYKFLLWTLLEGALPSLTAAKRFASSFLGFPICESGFLSARFDGVQDWLKSIGAQTPIVFGCSDATAVLPRLHIRADGSIVGVAVPDSQSHTTDLRAGKSVNELLEKLQEFGLATEIDAYLLTAPDPAKPSYYLAFFGQIKKGLSAATIATRWRTISEELDKRGIVLMATTLDGGGANLSAQLSFQEVRFSRVLLTHSLTHSHGTRLGTQRRTSLLCSWHMLP